MRYPRNILLWLFGFTQLGTLDYKPGWNAWKFLPVYLIDCGLNVITGGAVCTISRRAQDHRSGWAWDKLLDVIEKFDRDHGALSGPPLWGSKECGKWTQVLVTGFWMVVIYV